MFGNLSRDHHYQMVNQKTKKKGRKQTYNEPPGKQKQIFLISTYHNHRPKPKQLLPIISISYRSFFCPLLLSSLFPCSIFVSTEHTCIGDGPLGQKRHTILRDHTIPNVLEADLLLFGCTCDR